MRWHLDMESRSVVDLTKDGIRRYVTHPLTDVCLFSYATDYNDIRTYFNFVFPTEHEPTEFLDAIENGCEIGVHNAQMEYQAWNNVQVAKHKPHWPKLRMEQLNCTLSRAAAMGLPLALKKLAPILGCPHREAAEGVALMKKLTKPAGFFTDGSPMWHEDPAEWVHFAGYCNDDVRDEMGVDAVLPELTPYLHDAWLMDQRINERGYAVNVPFIRRAAQLVEYTQKQNDAHMRRLTNRAVGRVSSDKKIIAWLNENGVECDSLKKGDIDNVKFKAQYMGGPNTAEVVELRADTRKTSTAKYAKCDAVYDTTDDRIKYSLQFHAAGTGRWGGRLNQPQNYKRADMSEDYDRVPVEAIRSVLNNLSLSVAEQYQLAVQELGHLQVLDGLSKCLRGTIKAATGFELFGGDFKNVEGRFNAWISNELWKLRAFEEYDAGTGPDLYKVAYGAAFNVDPSEATGRKRQIGKVQELALGYQGAVNAYLTMAATYMLNPFELADIVYEITDPYTWAETAKGYHRQGVDRCGLQEKQWTALKILVDKWRKAHPNIVQGWWDLQDAAIQAVYAPGSVVNAYSGRVQYYSDGSCLYCILPSGRMLAYHRPEIGVRTRRFVNKNGVTQTRHQKYVSFWGTDSKTKQWRKQSLYGGLQCENIVQGGCVDLLLHCMQLLDMLGFPIVLTVHDEIVVENLIGHNRLTKDGFDWAMSQKPAWAKGMPVVSSTWRDLEYVK